MTSSADLHETVMPALAGIAREAGAIAMRFFRPGSQTSAKVWSKAGGSPVTEADIAVDIFLKARLTQLMPEAAWLSEETADDPQRIGRERVWIVDPIDGTRAYLSGDPNWSVAIALLEDGRPTLGIVYVPALDAFYEAERGGGARRNGERLTLRERGAGEPIRASGPKPLVDRLERMSGPFERLARVPSLALRIARVAEGSIDAGLVSSNARDWDIAAADLVLGEAGGLLSDLDGRSPVYNLPDPVHGELLAAPTRLHKHLIDAIKSG